jgi:hypothetical protein
LKADQINAYSWSIFFIDRIGAVSQDWIPSFQIDRIITPFPRPWEEYETVSGTNYSHGIADSILRAIVILVPVMKDFRIS